MEKSSGAVQEGKFNGEQMKIFLIFPQIYVPRNGVFDMSVGFPLGIAYLASVLENNNYAVEVMDAFQEGLLGDNLHEETEDAIRVSKGMFCKNKFKESSFSQEAFYVGVNMNEVLNRIKKAKPDLVGLSCIFSSQFLMVLEIAKAIKKRFSSLKIIVGGSHVTVSPKETLMNDNVDYIIMGEGEESFLEFVRRMEKNEPIDDILGLGFKKTNKEIVINDFKLIDNLDEVSFPAYHKFNMENYFKSAAEGRVIKMITSRGCTFNCYFCSVPVTSKRRFRMRSAQNVIDEIKFLKQKYDIKGVMFEDDNMTMNIKRAKEIFRVMKDSGFGLELHARNLRLDLLDSELIELMKACGMKKVWITPESGNQRILTEVIDKKLNLKEVDKVVDLVKRVGLEIAAAFVIGFPDETKQEISETLNYARKLKKRGVNEFWFSIARPIIGTRFYDDALKMGLIKGMNYNLFSYSAAAYDTKNFTAAEIKDIRESIMKELNN